MVIVAGTGSAAAVPAWSPPHEGGAPREASTERDEQHEVAALQAAGGDGFLEGDVHRRGAGVAVTVDVDEDPLHRQVYALGPGLDDAGGRLVRDEQGHLGGGGFGARE